MPGSGRKLADQYSAVVVIEALSANGDFTSGKNADDLGGLSITPKACRMNLKGKEAPVIGGFTGDQRFSLSWPGFGAGWC